jgi:iron complex transport system permease protein
MKIITLKKVITLSILLSLLLILVILISVTMGSVKVPPLRSIRILFQSLLGLKGTESETERTIILSLRLPRAILAGFVGAGLSVSGVTFQALLRNPLADPYILGVSSGAAVGAILAILLGLGTFSLGLPLASFPIPFCWLGSSLVPFFQPSSCFLFLFPRKKNSIPLSSG